jgi:hypothetical protein
VQEQAESIAITFRYHNAFFNHLFARASSPPHIFYPSRHRIVPNVRDDKNIIPSSTSLRFHDSSEARLPGLLPESVLASVGSCSNCSTLRPGLAHAKQNGVDGLGHRKCDRRIQSIGVWTQDEGIDDRKGASRYASIAYIGTNVREGTDVLAATRDARIQSGAAFVSGEMKNLNRSFSQAHAMSIHLNLITIGATLFYGWRLGTKLQFDGV